MPFSVAIVGRPNAGKSTLFNRLVGKRLALVDDTPGVTRDRREGEARLFDLDFTVIDTAGMDEVRDDSLEARMRAQSARAIAEADAVLFLLDARAGVTAAEEILADELREASRPVLVLANKCEGASGEAGWAEAFALGLGEPVAFSAEHGTGMDAVYEFLQPIARALETAEAEARPEGGEPLQLAIVGRPNVGKSTLINRLIGEDRLLTGPEAGITRDAISVEWQYKDRPIKLVDTAGMRRKTRVSEKLEKLAVADGLRAVRFAHIVVLIVDATQGLDKQDLQIAEHTVDEGRGLLVALNKWDAVTDREGALQAVRDRLQRSLPQVKGIPLVTVSGLKKTRLDTLLDESFRIYDLWNTRVATPDLNQWLTEVTGAHPPPASGGRSNRIKYISQPKARPPTFVVFCGRPKDLPDTYLRYLENELRHDFDLPGVPIRFQVKKTS
jgi:GTP-binding protein